MLALGLNLTIKDSTSTITTNITSVGQISNSMHGYRTNKFSFQCILAD